MNKFNRPQRNIARERRLKRTQKRKAYLTNGNSSSSTKVSSNNTVSGKKQRKLLNKWRKAQKEALESGLVTMQDIEMMAADGEGKSEDIPQVKASKNKRVFNVKRRAKMRLKMAGSSSKGKITAERTSDADGDTMMQ